MARKVNMGGEVTVSINGAPAVPCDLQVETEPIDVTTMGRSEPDPDWEFVDGAGHFHAFDHEGNLPTLVARQAVEEVAEDTVEIDSTDDELDDYWEDYDTEPETRMHCLVCDEVVVPRWNYIPSVGREFAPGRTTWLLRTDDPVPNSRFSVLVTWGENQVFGFGDGTTAQYQDRRFVTFCGPMARRKKTVVPAR